MLADDMGLGKTIQALAATELLRRNKGIERVLVVAPASVKYQWKTEIDKFTNLPAQVIDGLLIDHQAKGIAVALDGVDEIEGRKAYRLGVKLPSGVSHHVWIDAETFLDIKYDRVSRNALGRSATTWVSYRDYRTIDGLQIPSVIELGAANGHMRMRAAVAGDERGKRVRKYPVKSGIGCPY